MPAFITKRVSLFLCKKHNIGALKRMSFVAGAILWENFLLFCHICPPDTDNNYIVIVICEKRNTLGAKLSPQFWQTPTSLRLTEPKNCGIANSEN